ncbi:MAG: hypothetical protein ACQGVK_03610 [Myxococcota bacterium]
MGRAVIARLAAILILLSQAIALWVAVEPTGQSAIVFSFVGHPLLGSGVLLAIVAMVKRPAGAD